VLAAAGDYLHETLGDRASGAALGDEVRRRTASLAAAWWVLRHGRWLAGARRATIASGEHDPGYRERLVSLYGTPQPDSEAEAG
jgi:hypothetical protein